MKVLVVLNWIGVMAGCIAGGVIGVTGMATAQSAPQEAVVVCLALACAVIPLLLGPGMDRDLSRRPLRARRG